MTVPVGKVRVVRMYPLSFKEFLRASDIHTYEYIEQLTAIEKLPEIILNKLKLEYRRYLVCGGMPDAACASWWQSTKMAYPIMSMNSKLFLLPLPM